MLEGILTSLFEDGKFFYPFLGLKGLVDYKVLVEKCLFYLIILGRSDIFIKLICKLGSYS